jgi:hypothetical protein
MKLKTQTFHTADISLFYYPKQCYLNPSCVLFWELQFQDLKVNGINVVSALWVGKYAKQLLLSTGNYNVRHHSSPVLIPTFMTNILVVQKLKREHTQACAHAHTHSMIPKAYFSFIFLFFRKGSRLKKGKMDTKMHTFKTLYVCTVSAWSSSRSVLEHRVHHYFSPMDTRLGQTKREIHMPEIKTQL